MDRRTFLKCSVLASGAAVSAPLGLTEPSATSLRLTLNPRKPGYPVPADFTGLSYESSQIADPQFFSDYPFWGLTIVRWMVSGFL
jgi:hypothetical protein